MSKLDDDSDERLLLDEDALPWTPAPTRSLWHRRRGFILQIIAVLLAFFIGSALGYVWQRRETDQACTRRVSHYSPLLKDVDIEYTVQRFNGSLLKENIFRQQASPEVDAAWEALGVNYRSIRVPPDQAGKAGLANDQVQINEKYGGGYPANVEGLHQLHCLNLLRQTLHWNYDYYHALGQGAFQNDDTIVQRHTTHCLDIIRQQLMCTVDIGVLGQVWISPDHPTPFVDFNTQHVCRNFDAVREWAEMNQLPGQVPGDFLAPPTEGGRVYAEIP
ncbi:hypothetical protein ASPZODRAFT_70555 [Penicilliopsis zonata CBS 506.65]|uniref:Tat pathway signal sequence n=1 Tax=Penicilliopsis zonata CBS 506.65 TaxID=1073090 RepID=A0A1L9SD18_9EURO|nr:hypothetical protein ASPZODRAFT_70555 [Penicilliopsis zonata CBS 506.65]OJJ45071.1 hypothetical protein ASPZODRAFT_70555 [Penicilliopsis zonata CBS 506.65]